MFSALAIVASDAAGSRQWGRRGQVFHLTGVVESKAVEEAANENETENMVAEIPDSCVAVPFLELDNMCSSLT